MDIDGCDNDNDYDVDDYYNIERSKCNLMMTIITIIITFNKVDSIIYSHFADEKIETKKIKYLVLCHTDRNRGKSKYWTNCILLSYPTTTTTIMY